ncbi:MAG: hypothetical protein A2Y76_14015 [Planctomycetes bacterium RBG_13_60_9]|nr:MAG: hypothetical protein A2Y76_14015 [Planctomycetes bacterium RBG_13_60_9]
MSAHEILSLVVPCRRGFQFDERIGRDELLLDGHAEELLGDPTELADRSIRKTLSNQVQPPQFRISLRYLSQRLVRSKKGSHVPSRLRVRCRGRYLHIVTGLDIPVDEIGKPGAFASADQPDSRELAIHDIIQSTQPLDRFVIDHPSSACSRQGQLFDLDLDGFRLSQAGLA